MKVEAAIALQMLITEQDKGMGMFTSGARGGTFLIMYLTHEGVQWLSGRVLDSRPKGGGFEPHQRHCVVSLSKNIHPSLVLVSTQEDLFLHNRKIVDGT